MNAGLVNNYGRTEYCHIASRTR